MIAHWLNTLLEATFQRKSEGGNVELGVLPSLGSAAFTQGMTAMRFEFPAIVYGHAL